MQRIGFHCTVLENNPEREGDKGEKEGAGGRRKSTGDITDNKSGCTYLPGNMIFFFFIPGT